MKKLMVVIGVVCLLCASFSCVSKKTADTLSDQKDSLALVVASKDSIINDVFSSINIISENLLAIKMRENIVNSNVSGEINKEQRAQINEDIMAISQLLQQNREAIEKLKKSAAELNRANIKLKDMEQLLANLNKQVAEKDADITEMKAQLEKLNFEVKELVVGVEVLTAERNVLKDVVAVQDDALNTAYFIVSAEKQLIESGLVSKSGFMGRTLKVNESYDLSKFIKVNRTDLNTIKIGHKKATIVTTHPASSYELVMGADNVVDSISIKDSQKFWESSKILVVSYK